MPAARTVLITGGAGFIGSRLGAQLVAAGDRVLALDVLHPQVHSAQGRPADLDPAVELLPCDVTSPSSWDAALRLARPDVVVHLAAETGTGQSLDQASRHGSVNVVGTTQLCDALTRADHRPDHLVLASSRAVYGEGAWQAADGSVALPPPRRHDDLVAGRWEPRDSSGPDGAPLTVLAQRAATVQPRPANIYAATKLAQEHILGAWAAAREVPLSTLRFQNVYGPGQSLTNSYTGIVTLFCRVAKAGETINVYEDGLMLRDFVFVDDVVSALVASIEQPPAVSRLLDVGCGQATTLLAAAEMIAAMYGAPAPQVSGMFRDGDVRSAYADVQDIKAELGWTPAWSLEAGLGALVTWVNAVLG
jgi:dTDP-L-rhamnose 4-epimerase